MDRAFPLAPLLHSQKLDSGKHENEAIPAPFPPFLPSSLLFPPSSLFSLLLFFLFSFLLFFSLFSSHRVEGDVGDPQTVEQPHASEHQVEGESSFNSCTCICASSIASFPGHSCLQFLIACSMQKQPEGEGLG